MIRVDIQILHRTSHTRLPASARKNDRAQYVNNFWMPSEKVHDETPSNTPKNGPRVF